MNSRYIAYTAYIDSNQLGIDIMNEETVLHDNRLAICTADHTDVTLAQAVQAYLLDIDEASNVAELFKALADPNRVRIIGLLAHTEMCVGDLCLALQMSQPAVSYQLRILRTLHIVRSRKEGKHVFYTLDDDHIHELFTQGVNHVAHT